MKYLSRVTTVVMLKNPWRTVASWLVLSTPERAVWVQALSRDIVFLGKAFTLSASLHPSVQMGTDEFNAGRKPCDGLASHPGGSKNTPE